MGRGWIGEALKPRERRFDVPLRKGYCTKNAWSPGRLRDINDGTMLFGEAIDIEGEAVDADVLVPTIAVKSWIVQPSVARA